MDECHETRDVSSAYHIFGYCIYNDFSVKESVLKTSAALAPEGHKAKSDLDQAC